MAITLTPRLGLYQWSTGADGPSRTQFNTTFANIDARAAYDDGAIGGSALPTSDVVDGRYAQTVDGSYRRLFRRAGGAWSQVGGNTWSETQYFRADSGLPTAGAAAVRSHPSLPNPTATDYWDGSSVRGGRQAVGDLNTGLPGAVHVGDTISAVDLTVRGRVYARTSADGHRGFVASAHGNGAGPLFTARESGGTEPWLVDSRGRMRSQAPSAFGGASLIDGVPLGAAPGSSDLTAADLYAASGKYALRVFRSTSDSTAIASIAQDRITLGRAGWTGGRVDVLGPGLYLGGALEVDGAAKLDGGLTVAGVAAFGNMTATRLTATSAVQGASVVATAGLSAEGGRITSRTTGTGGELMTLPPVQISGSQAQSVRAPVCYQRQVNANLRMNTSSQNVDVSVVMGEDGYMRLDLNLYYEADVGAGSTPESLVAYFTAELRQGSTTLATSQEWVATELSDAPSRSKEGRGITSLTEIFPVRLAAGTYTVRIKTYREGALSGYLRRVSCTTMAVVLHSSAR